MCSYFYIHLAKFKLNNIKASNDLITIYGEDSVRIWTFYWAARKGNAQSRITFHLCQKGKMADGTFRSSSEQISKSTWNDHKILYWVELLALYLCRMIFWIQYSDEGELAETMPSHDPDVCNSRPVCEKPTRKEYTGSRGDVFAVRTAKPFENLWKDGLLWSRYSFVTNSIDRKPRDREFGTSCLGGPSGDVQCASKDMVCGYLFSKWRTMGQIRSEEIIYSGFIKIPLG